MRRSYDGFEKKWHYTIKLPWPPSDDPNDSWRPWLEQHAGNQGVNWEWMPYIDGRDTLVWIGFESSDLMTLFVLIYG